MYFKEPGFPQLSMCAPISSSRSVAVSPLTPGLSRGGSNMLSVSPAQAARVLYKPSLSPDHRPIGSHPGRRCDQWGGWDRQTLVTISSSLRSSHLQQGSDISEHFLGWVRSRSVSRIWHQENIIITGSSVTRPWAGVVAKTPVTSDSCLLRRVIN